MTNTQIHNLFFLEVAKGDKLLSNKGKSLSVGDYHIKYIISANLPLTLHNTSNKLVFVLGHPSYHQAINNDNFIVQYINNNSKDKYSSIDGEFLIIEIDKSQSSLKVVNSRFTNPTVFYSSFTDRFVLSTSYFKMIRFLTTNNLAKINSPQIYELLIFRRLFNNTTYDTSSKHLQPASILRWNKELTITNYWRITYKKNKLSLHDNAVTLNNLLQKSIQYKTSDNQRYGIMQSGGLDTRLILTNFTHNAPTAYTVTYEKNREYRVAKKLVSYKHGKHVWLQAKNGQYKDNIDLSSKITGGMNVADCMFFGDKYDSIIKKDTDILFAGYGMDYFFQGMYLPYKMFKILGEQIPWYKRIDKINGNIADYFINNISYRAKGLSLESILDKNKLKIMEDWIYNSVNLQYHDAKKYSDNVFDVWEHMSFGNLSRHYTYGGQLAKMELAEYRTISYTNELYKLYSSLPIDQRFDARIVRKALKLSDIRSYKLMSANHGYPAGYSSFQRSIAHITKRWPERIGIKEKDSTFERTWIDRETILRNEMHNRILQLKKSEVIEYLDIFNMDDFGNFINKWGNGSAVGNQTLMAIITIESFFKQVLE